MPRTPNPTGLVLGVSLALVVAAAAQAQNDSMALVGFEDFSGTETMLTFDDLGAVNGDDVATVDAASFSLSAGGAAKFFDDAFPRESGMAGTGSINNFWGFSSPYPDLEILFDGPMHRVGFELRANVMEDVAVVLLSNGEVLDEVVVPSRGDDALYFYGYENMAGFDGVLIDVVANPGGAFSLDNLAFESLVSEEPPEEQEEPPVTELPTFACEGFKSYPPAHGHRSHRAPFRALVARLVDADGNRLGPDDLSAPPAVRVLFTPHDSEESADVTEDVVWARMREFAPIRHDRWMMWLRAWHMRKPGVYLTTLESGDPASYTIDPVCADWISNEPPRRHRHWRHWDKRRDDDDRRDRHRRKRDRDD